MIKARLLIGVILLSLLAVLFGACAVPIPTPSPTPTPSPVPAPSPSPSPSPTPTPSPTPKPTPTPTISGTLKVYVTDAPPREEVTSVNVTISQVQVHKAVAEQEREQSGSDNQIPEQEQQQIQEGEGEWITIDLSDNTTFDLLQIEGIEQFFGSSEVAAGKYTQVRLVVDAIKVKLGNQEPQDATLPSNELKLVRPFDVMAGETTLIVLDFDADKMVTVTGAGKIIVKPVIKLTVRQEKPTGQKDGEKPPTETVEEASVEVSCDEFMAVQDISQELEVNVDDSFIVTLCSNPTTGFQWSETAQISDQTVLEQVDHKFVSPESEPPPPPGTPGQEIWTFKALEEGTSTISMEYSQPWEGGEKGEWTFELTVVVK